MARNIAAEVKRGNTQRRLVARARRQAEKGTEDDEVDVENAVSGTINLNLDEGRADV